MSSVEAKVPPRNSLPSRLGTPSRSQGRTSACQPRNRNTALLTSSVPCSTQR
ncbi:hypothetical protein D9M69_316080 [compost metagenome]